MTATVSPQWSQICKLTDLDPERGAVALVHGRQVALFRTHDDEVYAIGHRDPFSGAYVLARGIVGSRGGADGEVPTVASPMYKQVFDLRTGRCLDDEKVAVPSYPVRLVDGMVEVGTPRTRSEPRGNRSEPRGSRSEPGGSRSEPGGRSRLSATGADPENANGRPRTRAGGTR